jgi:hypothetical protein
LASPGESSDTSPPHSTGRVTKWLRRTPLAKLQQQLAAGRRWTALSRELDEAVSPAQPRGFAAAHDLPPPPAVYERLDRAWLERPYHQDGEHARNRYRGRGASERGQPRHARSECRKAPARAAAPAVNDLAARPLPCRRCGWRQQPATTVPRTCRQTMCVDAHHR